jgi:hypothetical protein
MRAAAAALASAFVAHEATSRGLWLLLIDDPEQQLVGAGSVG